MYIHSEIVDRFVSFPGAAAGETEPLMRVALNDVYGVYLTSTAGGEPSAGCNNVDESSAKKDNAHAQILDARAVLKHGGFSASLRSLCSKMKSSTPQLKGSRQSAQSLRAFPQALRTASKADLLATDVGITVFALETEGQRPFGMSKRPKHRTYTFLFPASTRAKSVSPDLSDALKPSMAMRWMAWLQPVVLGHPVRDPFTESEKKQSLPTRRILVLINPFGGNKRARELYEKYVAPMFALADVQATIQCRSL